MPKYRNTPRRERIGGFYEVDSGRAVAFFLSSERLGEESPDTRGQSDQVMLGLFFPEMEGKGRKVQQKGYRLR